VRILLDECLPAELADELPGHEARTVQQEGWSSLENGALLARASGQFSAFITVDKHIESTQRLPLDLAVVTLRARTNRIESLRPLIPELLRVLHDIRPGSFRRVGA
jgi:predicted nuclease of predicted toxin-antitoxin system